ncbi:hypothetical protein BBOV_II003400 [Babesia bovis T2Bo]|uniref:Uncharacterized protein n=1 Tax=Babesia bovis TaxID=5865 RepID=A7ATN4_BABBO|nr:hypothetical protein BBOV_II003400 [Babesia bovis T2Bo]EDO06295.1 hypothetical protein BBOV_II003400 [Babesia bovis T2Bo]|eukprot:XP_001609863.1 hypothetical protein [Babesia bovis T2Bo]
MSSTNRSALSTANSCSTHSYLFGFHITDLTLFESVSQTLRDDRLSLIWKIAQRSSDIDAYNLSTNDGCDPGCRCESSYSTLSNGSATSVDPIFCLLRCCNDGQDKVAVKGGALSISIVSPAESTKCLCTLKLNLRGINVSANLNFIRTNLFDRCGAVVGQITLRYVSQQRWVKINKRKLSFLNGDRDSSVNSMVETSLNYATSALNDKNVSTPLGNSRSCSIETSHVDDFVMLFWNSTKICFVKQHPDDYQLQLMLKFMQSSSCRGTTTESWIQASSNMVFDDVSRLSRMNTVSNFNGSSHSSEVLDNHVTLGFPDIPHAMAENSGITPVSELTSDLGVYNDDFSTRSGLSLMTDPGSVRLYDYLSEQNRIIQTTLTRQLTVDSMTTSSWTDFTGDISARASLLNNEVSVSRGLNISIPQSGPIQSSTMQLPLPIDKTDVSNDISSSVPLNKTNDHPAILPSKEIDTQMVKFNRLVMRNVETSDNGTHEIFKKLPNSTGVLKLSESDRHLSLSGETCFQPSKPTNYIDIGSSKGVNVLKHGEPYLLSTSLSTIDPGPFEAGDVVQSHNSFDWYNEVDLLPCENFQVNGSLIDKCGTRVSLRDTESHLDIIEDAHCSVTVESDTPAAIADDLIDLDRFYVDEYDFSGAGGSNTLNAFYSKEDNSATKVPGVSTLKDGVTCNKDNLVSAVYNAITADISNMSLSDLGVEHVECNLDLISDALQDARALQFQQGKLSTDLLMNFYFQLLRCHSMRGVPQVMLMEEVIQRHFAAAELLNFLPTDYNSTVIRISMDILVQQLGMSIPGETQSTEDPQQGNGDVPSQIPSGFWKSAIDDANGRRKTDFVAPLSECDTYSEASDAAPLLSYDGVITQSQLASRHLESLQHEMHEQFQSVDLHKIMYLSRLDAKASKKRTCVMTLLAVRLALYRVFCGRRKLHAEVRQIMVV